MSRRTLRALDVWPRRSDGLPPGQGEVRAFPRFSDEPFRWAPSMTDIDLTVSVGGEERRRFNSSDLAAFDRVEITADFHCVTTWSYRGLRWSGIRFVDLIADVFDGDVPPFMLAKTADTMASRYRTDDLAHPDVLLATHLDGEPLDRRHGAPLRLVSPHQYGYKNPKHLTELAFSDTEPEGTLGPKEHLRARVDVEERHGKRPNWLLRIPYRLAIVPTALAAERALGKSPD